MAMGSGSASQVVAFGLLVMLCFVMHGELAESATTYTVGDSGGWTFSSGSWPSGKRFKAGDVLSEFYPLSFLSNNCALETFWLRYSVL